MEEPCQPPKDIKVGTDDGTVLNEFPSVKHARAMLASFIYALNFSYPGEIKYVLDALQKISMQIEQKKIPWRFSSLSFRL